jgi:hypothetical protein
VLPTKYQCFFYKKLVVFLITRCRRANDFSSMPASVLLPRNLTATTSGVLLTKSLETAGLIEGFNDWKVETALQIAHFKSSAAAG